MEGFAFRKVATRNGELTVATGWKAARSRAVLRKAANRKNSAVHWKAASWKALCLGGPAPYVGGVKNRAGARQPRALCGIGRGALLPVK